LIQFGIIIPTYNNLAELKTCLSLLREQVNEQVEVLVCVDGSTDGTLEWLSSQTFPCSFKVLHHPEFKNRGRLETRNLGIRNTIAENLIFLDSDLEIQSGWLEAHAQALDKYSISLGRVHFRNTDNPWTDYYNSRGFNKDDDSKVVSVRYFITGNVGLKRKLAINAILKLEKTVVYGEDLLLACSLYSSGIQSCYYNAKAVVGGVLNKTVQEARRQYIPFIQTVIIPLSKKNAECAQFFNAKKVAQWTKKWHFLLSFFEVDLNYWSNCIDALPASLLTRWAIRVVLFLTMTQEFSKNNG
jgi:glycosyltransferase involved in cell wall biosynthesis